MPWQASSLAGDFYFVSYSPSSVNTVARIFSERGIALKPIQPSPKVERIRDGEMDWGRKVIRVKGFGAATKTFPKHV